MTAAKVADAVARYWKSKGAKPEPASPLNLQPLAISEKRSKRLGVAVAPPALSEAADAAILHVLEKGRAVETMEGAAVRAAIKRLRLPDATLYFDDLRKRSLPGWTLFSFTSTTNSSPRAAAWDGMLWRGRNIDRTSCACSRGLAVPLAGQTRETHQPLLDAR